MNTVGKEQEQFAAPPQAEGRLDWGAIWGGSLASIGLWVLLTIFGLAAGLSAVNPREPNLEGVAIWLGIWSLIVPILALLPGVLLTGRAAHVARPLGGVMHGAVVWGMTTFVAATALILLPITASLASAWAAGQPAAAANTTTPMPLSALHTLGANLWWPFFSTLLGLGAALGAGYMTAHDRPHKRSAERSVPIRSADSPLHAGV